MSNTKQFFVSLKIPFLFFPYCLQKVRKCCSDFFFPSLFFLWLEFCWYQKPAKFLLIPNVSELLAEKLPQAWSILSALSSDADFCTAGVLPFSWCRQPVSVGCSYQPSIKNSTWIRGHDTVRRQIFKHYCCKEGGCNQEHIIKKSLVREMKHFRMESSELYTASMKVKMSPYCAVL